MLRSQRHHDQDGTPGGNPSSILLWGGLRLGRHLPLFATHDLCPCRTATVDVYVRGSGGTSQARWSGFVVDEGRLGHFSLIASQMPPQLDTKQFFVAEVNRSMRYGLFVPQIYQLSCGEGNTTPLPLLPSSPPRHLPPHSGFHNVQRSLPQEEARDALWCVKSPQPPLGVVGSCVYQAAVRI